jgi:hypothetical protein
LFVDFADSIFVDAMDSFLSKAEADCLTAVAAKRYAHDEGKFAEVIGHESGCANR